MTYTATLNGPDSNVVMPNGTRYQGGAAVVLSDDEYSRLSPTALAALMNVVPAGGAESYTCTLGPYVHTALASWDFETGTQGWKTTNATIAQSSAWAETGTQSLLITANSNAAGAGYWQSYSPFIPVAPNQLYSGTAWLESPTVALAHTHLNISWYDTSQNFLTSAAGTFMALGAGRTLFSSLYGARSPAGAAFAALASLDTEGSATGTQMAVDTAFFYQSAQVMGVVLPDGRMHKAGDVVVLSDGEYSTMTPAAIASLFSSVIPGVS